MNTWHRIISIWRVVLMVAVALGLALPVRPAAAQTTQRCFTETGYCIGGRFLQYWQQNGGLATFGFPLSAEIAENGFTVQYFERQRFELHPENSRPYDVLLGRLGAQLLGPAPVQPDSGARAGCMWFPETRQNVCNQQASIGFASYWQQNGLEFDGRRGKSYPESLALFGFPITGLIEFTTPEGSRVQAQWFERARFEWHPNNPNPFKVLLGRLGAEVRLGTPTPTPGTVNQVQIFLVSPGTGNVGCGDELVPITRRITPTTAPLTAALNELFNLKTQTIGESGLYNALYQSDLRLESASITNGRATINISGQLRINGVCDDPRVIAQIERTVFQFPTVTSAEIFLNGTPLADAF